MRKAKLIVFPPGVRREPGTDATSYLVHSGRFDGYQLNTWSKERTIDLPDYTHLLYNWPGAVRAANGKLEFYSFADTSRLTYEELKPSSSLWLFDRDTGQILGKPKATISGTRDVPVSCSYNHVAIAYLDRLWIVPSTAFAAETEPFHFKQEQSHFVLNLLKPTTVSYHAEGAVNYKLTLRDDSQNFIGSGSLMELESKDGKFELTLDKAQFATKALSEVKAADRNNPNPRELKAYLQSVTPYYDLLTGRRPSGILVPVYATVMAEHADGRQKACLAHAFLVEVPPSELPKPTPRIRSR